MESQEFMTSGRVAETCVEKLWGEARKPNGEREMAPFDQEIIWIEETESAVAFMHGGEEVEKFGTFNDFYGYGTSSCGRSGAIATARRIAEKFGVTVESSAQVVVTKTTYRRPAIAARSREALELNAKADKDPKYKRKFAEVPESWRQRREETIHGGETHTYYPMLERRVISEEVVWCVGNGVSVVVENAMSSEV